MQCDLCGGVIHTNRDDWVMREEPTSYRDTTLVTYAAHQACHELKEATTQQSSHWSFLWKPAR